MGRVWEQVQRHRTRALKTLVQYAVYGTLGLSLGVIGPTLLDLRQQVRTSLSTIALIMTTRAGGNVIGALISELN